MQLMTSVINEEISSIDDFEEGEIVDDDEPSNIVDNVYDNFNVGCVEETKGKKMSGLNLKISSSDHKSENVLTSCKSSSIDSKSNGRSELSGGYRKRSSVRSRGIKSPLRLSHTVRYKSRYHDETRNTRLRGIRRSVLRESSFNESRRKTLKNVEEAERKNKRRSNLVERKESSLLKRLVGSGWSGLRSPQRVAEEGVQQPVSEAETERKETEEELQLRAEALKTAWLKKISLKKSQGFTLKKKTQDDPSGVSANLSLIEAVEADISFANSLDSNEIISEERELLEVTHNKNEHKRVRASSPVPDIDLREELMKQYCNCPVDNEACEPEPKKIKLELEERIKAEVLEDDLENELELRNIALMSFWNKSKPVKESEKEEVLLAGSEENGDRVNGEEDWEELDADILRAQLLSSLTSLQEKPSKTCHTTDFALSKTKPSQMKKKEVDLEFEKQCRIWCERMVPSLIISLESDSESDKEQSDYEKSVDKLLNEARICSDLIQSSAAQSSVEVPQGSKVHAKGRNVSSLSTPTAVRHLPVHQQEEYRRLKLKLAEKERLRDKVQSVVPTIPDDGLKVDSKDTVIFQKPIAPPRQKLVSTKCVSPLKRIIKKSIVSKAITSEKKVKTVLGSLSKVSLSKNMRSNSNVVLKARKLEGKITSEKYSKTDNAKSVEQNALPVVTSVLIKEERVSKIECNSKLEVAKVVEHCGEVLKEVKEGSSEVSEQLCKSQGEEAQKDEANGVRDTVERKLAVVKAMVSESEEVRLRYEKSASLVERLRELLMEAEARRAAEARLLTQLGQRATTVITAAKNFPVLDGDKSRLQLMSEKIFANVNIPVQVASQSEEEKPVRQTSCWDPDRILCPFGLAGTCKDPACTFQHLEAKPS